MGLRVWFFAAACAALGVGAASAQGFDIEIYGGVQGAPHSTVTGVTETGVPFDFTSDWEGRSFDAPIYYGGRIMYDLDRPWSFGIEFTHAKVYASEDTLTDSGFTALEFTDGLNIITVNAERDVRFTDRWKAYGGLGLGIAVPHVDVETPTGGDTFEFQLTGPALRWYVGGNFALTRRWSLFAEYQGTFSSNDANLDGGGDLDTDIVTNAFNLGIGFSF
ncbi:MAG: outer membrane beta-barrel protein [Pseudomonadota bacterium]